VLTLGLILFVALPAIAVVVSAEILSEEDFRPEVMLPATLLIGLISLIGVLTLLVAVFSRLELTSREGALGLPDGTIQAIIALALILIFAIVGVYLHAVAGDGTTLEGLTEAQVDALPVGDLISRSEVDPGSFTAVVRNSAREDLATQLLTTISTLVVAVAGFYFGAKSVREGARAGAEAAMGGTSEVAAAPSPTTPGPGAAEEAPGEEVDEATAYGEQSPVTGLSATDIEQQPEQPEPPTDEPHTFEEHPDYQPEPDFYPDEDDAEQNEEAAPEPDSEDEEETPPRA
jgi:hypothetical protein